MNIPSFLNAVRHADLCVDTRRLVAEKIVTGKFDTHGAADIFFELENTDAVQFPRRVLDFNCNEPAAVDGIKPESCGQKDIEFGLREDPLFLCDSNPGLGAAAAITEVEILVFAGFHVHIGPEVGKPEACARSGNGKELRRVE